MSSSKSAPSNTTSTSATVETTNLNVSGNEGITLLAADGGAASVSSVSNDNRQDNSTSVQINTTSDKGAIEAGRDIALKGISASVGLSQNALDTVSSVSQNAVAFQDSALRTTQDALLVIGGKFVDAVSEFEARGQTTLGNTVSALNQIAKDQNQSANQLVVQASQDAQAQAGETIAMVIKWVALAAAAAVIGYAVTRE